MSSGISELRNKVSDHGLRQKIESITDIVQKAGDRIRQIAHNLMPPEFEKAGLAESLREYVLGIGAPVFTFSAFGKERRFSPERELNIYRLVSELVQNIRKHACATRANMQLFFHEEQLSIVIEHDGKPTPTNGEGHNTPLPGIGMMSIRTRLEYLDARLLADGDKKGNLAILEVPYSGMGETGSRQET